MKFGKEFVTQMVPEWQQAYMDYDYLKSLLKEIQRSKQRHKTPPAATALCSHRLKRRLTLYRAFSGLTLQSRHSQQQPNSPSSISPVDIESQAILVNSVRSDGSESYQTTFLMAAEEGSVQELEYFRKVDDEFNKVDKFYRSKVDEVMKEAAVLNKQMDAFIAFRINVENPQRPFDWSVEMTRLASDVAASTAALAASTPRGVRASRRAAMATDVIEESGSNSQEEHSGDEEKDGKKTENAKTQEKKAESLRGARPSPLDILNHVTMNHTVETPVSTIKGFLNRNLKKVEEQLKGAFIEFYRKLRLLKSYRDTSKSYMNMVDNSYFGSSDEITKLMETVETTVIKYFSNSNRRKGMDVLRPKTKIERHSITFAMGCFAGCTAALTLALILMVRAHSIKNPNNPEFDKGNSSTWTPCFPYTACLDSFFCTCLCMLEIYTFGGGSESITLSYLVSSKELSWATESASACSVLLNLDMEMDPKPKITKRYPNFSLSSWFCFDIIMPLQPHISLNRYFFLVTLPDFFLADQLTSQVQAIRSLQFYVCYYGWGDYKHRQNTCKSYDVFNTFTFIVACIPYWSRLLQCLRRLVEEKDHMQGYNGLKYFFTIVAVSMRTAYNLESLKNEVNWRILAGVFSIVAAIYGTYWDLLVDWGLLQRNSKNRWLRDKLLLPYKSVYFGAMVLNVLLRFAWLQTVLKFNVSFMHTQTMIAVVASLEIIRRGIWSFFRLENEHLNNVGKYRTFKSVPLPFNYDEDQGKHE
ncbi:Phosphate transporter PHO1 homolog 3 [Prunus dulcis]|uniref:Phosphate transporter PHO1 homolog 3 n=1 Tax=Prunus dulcis TaxID=3755 RepID=A0A4Y1QR09_PRUDU|nr:Phosphate transporter PHO1 homolog 3 [Prunus dulcis]